MAKCRFEIWDAFQDFFAAVSRRHFRIFRIVASFSRAPARVMPPGASNASNASDGSDGTDMANSKCLRI